MIPMIRRRLAAGQDGAALVWVAGMMVALLAMTALAVDLGWYYLNAGRLQRAADAAALAGAANLPSALPLADGDGQDAAEVNGFGAADYVSTLPSDHEYRVELTTQVPTFFATVVGIDELPLTRTSTAEHIPPVVMGSPASCFGVGNPAIVSSLPPSAQAGCAAYVQNFWAAINFPYTPKQGGDPYSVVCDEMLAPDCVTTNDEYRATGFYYGIEADSPGGSVDVWLYDAGYYARSWIDVGTGDFPFNPTPAPAFPGGYITFELLAPDTTPRNPTDNVVVPGCSLTIQAETDAAVYEDQWVKLCTAVNPGGVFALNVRTSGTGGGSNHYSVATSASSGSTRIYAIKDMSAFTNAATGTARVDLAEVPEAYAGRTLNLRFYDPGESSADEASMTVRSPDGSIPKCSWTDTDSSGSLVATHSNVSCSIVTTIDSTPQFNQHWLDVEIEIPPADSYTCGSNCYWTVDLELAGAHDRTTWSAWAQGNPIRLVPNS